MATVKLNDPKALKYLMILKNMKEFLEERSDIGKLEEITAHLKEKGHKASFAAMFLILSREGFLQKENELYRWNNLKPCNIHTAEMTLEAIRRYGKDVKVKGYQKKKEAEFMMKKKSKFNLMNLELNFLLVFALLGVVSVWQSALFMVTVSSKYSVHYMTVFDDIIDMEFVVLSSIPLLLAFAVNFHFFKLKE
jgi:hypothetical protein